MNPFQKDSVGVYPTVNLTASGGGKAGTVRRVGTVGTVRTVVQSGAGMAGKAGRSTRGIIGLDPMNASSDVHIQAAHTDLGFRGTNPHYRNPIDGVTYLELAL